MAVHHFTVNVPNPSDKPVAARLRLDQKKRGGFRVPLDVPDGPLEVVSAGLTLDACKTSTDKEIVVKLGPFQSVDVHVIADVNPSGRGGGTAFHVSDERDGRVVGGVTLICVDRVGPEHPGSIVTSPNPCPVIAGDPYIVQAGGDPTKAKAKSIALGTTMELVVPLMNPTRAALRRVQVYLEHLGISDATFQPATWNLGDLRPKDTFFATWKIDAHGAAPGGFHASVVALSEDHEPVRLQVPFTLQRDDRLG